MWSGLVALQISTRAVCFDHRREFGSPNAFWTFKRRTTSLPLWTVFNFKQFLTLNSLKGVFCNQNLRAFLFLFFYFFFKLSNAHQIAISSARSSVCFIYKPKSVSFFFNPLKYSGSGSLVLGCTSSSREFWLCKFYKPTPSLTSRFSGLKPKTKTS